jgi:hypothetical protein
MSHGTFVYGRELVNGDVLQKDDVYNSTSGRWDKCPCPGLTLQGFDEGANNPVIWVRPEEQFPAADIEV